MPGEGEFPLPMGRVGVVATGVSNEASLLSALKRAGATVVDVLGAGRASDVLAYEHVIVPGVGHVGAALAALREAGLADAVQERIARGRPTLCVCVGLQLLAHSSAEAPGVPGLGVLSGVHFERFPAGCRVPQQAWNRVEPDALCRMMRTAAGAAAGAGEGATGAATGAAHAYFSNSYCARAAPLGGGWGVATATHGGATFVAGLERGPVLALQFHPELSGAFGAHLLRAWLRTSSASKDGAGAADAAAAAAAAAAEPAPLPLPRVIPCLDVRDGRVVKGVKFAGLRDAGSPSELAAAYERQGADELVMLDVSATPEGRSTAVETVRAIRAACALPLTVGGGVDSVEAAARLLAAGADKVAVNSAAVARPALLRELADRFGSQCIVLAVDARRKEGAEAADGWEVVTRSGANRTGQDAVAWAARGTSPEFGAGEVLLTSFDRDGTREGFDLDLLRAATAAVTVPVVASGGADSAAHMAAAVREGGASAVLAASIFHFGDTTVARVKNDLRALGIPVRPVDASEPDPIEQQQQPVTGDESASSSAAAAAAAAGGGGGSGAAPSAAGATTSTSSSSSSSTTSGTSSDKRLDPPSAQAVVPSIDLMGGRVVQLVGGDESQVALEVAADDAVGLAERFRVAGEVAVVDLDAAMGKPSDENEALVRRLLRAAPCRVGGGIRTVSRARMWLDAGARKVVIGTAASVDFLRELNVARDRVVVALDAVDGEVVVDGWKTRTGASVDDRIRELAPFCGHFLLTFVEREGRMGGADIPAVAALVRLTRGLAGSTGSIALTIAGGVTTPDDVAALDALGVEAQIGMALYTGRLPLGQAVAAPLRSDRPDGLIPTVVVDEQSGAALGLAYSSRASVAHAVDTRTGAYFSRSRGELWIKGTTSGHTQELVRVDLDCDRDAIRFVVRQAGGGFCHRPLAASCFGRAGDAAPAAGGGLAGLARLDRTLSERVAELQAADGGEGTATSGSYTHRLLRDERLLRAKLLEEAAELAEARDHVDVAAEAADVLFFALTAARARGVALADVERVLDQRAQRVTRRAGNAKVPLAAGGGTGEAAAAAKADGDAPKAEEAASSSSSPSSSSSSSSSSQLLQVLTDPADATVRLQGRDPTPDASIVSAAQEIVRDVRGRGLEALVEHAVRLGDLPTPQGVEEFVKGPEALREAFEALSPADRGVLERTAARIRAFAVTQRASLAACSMRVPGGEAGHDVAAVERAGCYAPGGRYPLPSSVLMTAIPARVAGCREVWVATPRPTPVMLAAAHVAGADRVLCIGGPQAIAALAYGCRADGTGSGSEAGAASTADWAIPPVDCLCGPGNAYVTAAKQLVGGRVRIDMLAGPSELLVLADDSADPAVVAADMLGQAEHDVHAAPVLITTDATLPARVAAELEAQLATLPTAETARAAVERNGFAAVCPDGLDQAVALADSVAAEHVEIHTRAPDTVAQRLNHYGAIFIGAPSAEVFGDYGAGPNHSLPTGGTARAYGGLSVLTFLRVRTWLRLDADDATAAAATAAAAEAAAGASAAAASAAAGGKVEETGAAPISALTGAAAEEMVRDCVALARLEGLEGHARSAARRLGSATADSAAGGAASATPLLQEPAPRTDLMDAPLAIALPKGRMQGNVLRLLADAGLEVVFANARDLRPTVPAMPRWSIKMLKPRDCVRALHSGSRQVGFAGTDIIAELDACVDAVYDTRMDPVRVVCAVPEGMLARNGGKMPTSGHLRIATEYERLTQRWAASIPGFSATIVKTSGSTEAFVPDDADIIVDNTATGTTLRAAGLVPTQELARSSTHLVCNPAALQQPTLRAAIEQFKLLLASAQDAKGMQMLEFNVPRDKLDAIIASLPALRAPTVSTLWKDMGFAVKVAMRNTETAAWLPRIAAAGGRDILVTDIVQLVR